MRTIRCEVGECRAQMCASKILTRKAKTCHHAQISKEENMGVFFTNIVFFFAGCIIVYKFYILMSSQGVALALRARSIENLLEDGTSIAWTYTFNLVSLDPIPIGNDLEINWSKLEDRYYAIDSKLLENDMAVLCSNFDKVHCFIEPIPVGNDLIQFKLENWLMRLYRCGVKWFPHDMIQKLSINLCTKSFRLGTHFCRLIWSKIESYLGSLFGHHGAYYTGDSSYIWGYFQDWNLITETTIYHHIQIATEEITEEIFCTNFVFFFFSGSIWAYKVYLLMFSQCVVLALVAHSIERILMDRSSME